MTSERDVAAFNARATTYEQGLLGRMHCEIAERTAELLLRNCPEPKRILDVGCGTGYLLRLLRERCEHVIELAGVDPAPAMIIAAREASDGDRFWFGSGIGAENLPFGDGTFDVITAVTSFDHWSDQRAGIRECARVLDPNGRLVVVDQFSAFLLPTLVRGRSGKARTKARATRLLASAGFRSITWHRLYTPLINAVVASQ